MGMTPWAPRSRPGEGPDHDIALGGSPVRPIADYALLSRSQVATGTVRTATAPEGALPSAYSPARPGSAWSRGPGVPLAGGVSGISSRQMRPKDSSRGSTASWIS
jgi:hypothetical protein